MNESIATFVRGDDDQKDHPLLEAARQALKADPTPRYLKFRVVNGTPIEIEPDDPNSQVQE